MNRTKRFSLMFSEEEYAILEALAAELGMTLAATIRLLIRQEAIKEGLRPTAKQSLLQIQK